MKSHYKHTAHTHPDTHIGYCTTRPPIISINRTPADIKSLPGSIHHVSEIALHHFFSSSGFLGSSVPPVLPVLCSPPPPPVFLYMASPIFMDDFLRASTFSLSCSGETLSSSLAWRTASMSALMVSTSSWGTLSLCSKSVFSVWYTVESASFWISTLALRSASAVANCSASLTMRSMSPSLRPPELWMRICCCL